MDKIVNISDIEDLILTKYEIESKLIRTGKIQKKHTLEEFISKYISNIENLYTYFDKEHSDNPLSFSLLNLDSNLYIFNLNFKNINLLNNIINKIKNNQLQLMDITIESLENSYIINNMNYYLYEE